MNYEHISTESLIDYLHRELSPEEDARVHAHVGECAACRVAYQEQASLTERLRAFARDEERELPPRVLFAVRDRVARRTQPAWWSNLAVLFRPAVGLPFAAILVLAMILGFTSIRPRLAHAPTIAAAYYLNDHRRLSDRLMPFSQPPAVPSTLVNPTASQSANVANDTQSAAASQVASE